MIINPLLFLLPRKRYPKARDMPGLETLVRPDRHEVAWLKAHKGLTATDMARGFTRKFDIRAKVRERKRGKTRFEHKNRVIILTDKSWLKALHEIGHARWGRSELIAAAWSVTTFKAVFPRSKRGKWMIHELMDEEKWLN